MLHLSSKYGVNGIGLREFPHSFDEFVIVRREVGKDVILGK